MGLYSLDVSELILIASVFSFHSRDIPDGAAISTISGSPKHAGSTGRYHGNEEDLSLAWSLDASSGPFSSLPPLVEGGRAIWDAVSARRMQAAAPWRHAHPLPAPSGLTTQNQVICNWSLLGDKGAFV